MIILILAVVLLLFGLYNFRECFEDFLPSNQFTLFNYSYETQPKNISPLTFEEKPEMNCCLIEKKYLYKPGEPNNGNFFYTYTKLKNDKCNLNLYNLNDSKQLFIDGENGWDNNKCIESNSTIGSCRNINRECIEFVDKSYCDQYRMQWYNKPCNNSIPFEFKDRINLKLPPKDTSGAFQMFI